MKLACANALANLISDEELNEDYILPKAFDPRVGETVAKAAAEAARKTGVAQEFRTYNSILNRREISKKCMSYIVERYIARIHFFISLKIFSD